jgi:PTH1 family peptidyl-tRNA hydrolase
MKLVVGLGNPGSQYASNRHNIGFMAVDALAEKIGPTSFQNNYQAEIARVRVGDETILLMKPQTFMNRSGISVQGAMAFFKIKPADIIVIHDEIDLPLGTLRIKSGGGHGGNNGLRDISARIGPDYLRLRLGVGRPQHKGAEANHVLSNFRPEEEEARDKLIGQAARATVLILEKGVATAQMRYHKKGGQKKKGKPAHKPKGDASADSSTETDPKQAEGS